jgi:hypothetical protein
MPLGKIFSCLVCEDARPELGAKYTLLGFCGVTPIVQVGVANFSIPVSICFGFCAGPSIGNFDVSMKLIDPTGKVNIIPSASGTFEKETPGLLIFLKYQGLLQGPGKYRIILTLGDNPVFEDSLVFVQGPAK